jgi:hypothetical protein
VRLESATIGSVHPEGKASHSRWPMFSSPTFDQFDSKYVFVLQFLHVSGISSTLWVERVLHVPPVISSKPLVQEQWVSQKSHVFGPVATLMIRRSVRAKSTSHNIS